MGSALASFIAVCLCILMFFTMVFSYGSSETSPKKPTIADQLFGTEKIILNVSEKLKINPEEVVFEIDRKGEPYYVTPAGTYYAEFKDDGNGSLEIDYLMEVIK